MIPVYNPQGVYTGEVRGNTYFKEVDSRKHFMRKYKGYGISQSILDELNKRKVLFVQIREIDRLKVYKFRLSQYLHSTRTFVNQEKDLQRFVPLPEKNPTFRTSLANFGVNV